MATASYPNATEFFAVFLSYTCWDCSARPLENAQVSEAKWLTNG